MARREQAALFLKKIATSENTLKKEKAVKGLLYSGVILFFHNHNAVSAHGKHSILVDLAGFFLQAPPRKKLCNIIQAVTGIIYNKYDCESANLGIERFHALIPVVHIVTCVKKDIVIHVG